LAKALLALVMIALLSGCSTASIAPSAYALAQVYESKGLYDKAIETYDKALEKTYSSDLAYNRLVVMAKSSRAFEAAAAAMDGYRKTGEQRLFDLCCLVYRNEGDEQSLIAALESVKEPTDSILLELSQLYIRTGQDSRALEILHGLFQNKVMSVQMLDMLKALEPGSWDALYEYLYSDTTIAEQPAGTSL
jgi:tetratricopeptide (TPR) repeat protein